MFCWLRGEHILFTWDVFFSGFSLGVEPTCTIRPQRLPICWAYVCVCVGPRNVAPDFTEAYLSVGTPNSQQCLEADTDENDCPELSALRFHSQNLVDEALRPQYTSFSAFHSVSLAVEHASRSQDSPLDVNAKRRFHHVCTSGSSHSLMCFCTRTDEPHAGSAHGRPRTLLMNKMTRHGQFVPKWVILRTPLKHRGTDDFKYYTCILVTYKNIIKTILFSTLNNLSSSKFSCQTIYTTFWSSYRNRKFSSLQKTLNQQFSMKNVLLS